MLNIKIILHFIFVYITQVTTKTFQMPAKYILRDSPLSISITPDPNSVTLGQSLIIQCLVNTNSKQGQLMSKLTMSLFCPVTPSNTFCFQKCMPQCSKLGAEECQPVKALNNVTCRTILQSNGLIVHEYRVEHLTAEWLEGEGTNNSGFSCASAGERTPWIQLKEAVTTTSKAVPTTTTTTTTRAPELTKPTSTISTTSSSSSTTTTAKPTSIVHPIYYHDSGRREENLSQEKIMVFFISGLLLSFLVNVFWCIRCVLIRKYSKNTGDVKMKSFFCMESEVKAGRLAQKNMAIKQHQNMQQQKAYMIGSNGVGELVPIVDTSPSNESWSYEPVTNRVYIDGKVAPSNVSNSGERNSDSGVSVAQPSVLYTVTGQPVIVGDTWSPVESVTPSYIVRKPNHQFPQAINRHSQIYANQLPSSYSEFYEPNGRIGTVMKNVTSRDSIHSPNVQDMVVGSASERALSEIGAQKPYRFVRADYYPQPSWNPHKGAMGTPHNNMPYGPVPRGYPQQYHPTQHTQSLSSQAEESPATDKTGSRQMLVLLSANAINKYHQGQPRERTEVVLVKSDQRGSRTLTEGNESKIEGSAVPRAPTQVQNWLQNCETPELQKSPCMGGSSRQEAKQPGQPKLADSLNTEYDVASDWSETPSKNIS